MSKFTSEYLTLIGQIYDDAASRSQAPAKAVEDALSLPRTTATKHIRRAREAGFIKADWDGLQPLSPRVEKVAAALGVSSVDLVVAVMEHADGDLRLRRPKARGFS